MTTQPEALRLAQVAPYLEGGERGQWIMSAADELRRLHEVNRELVAALKDLIADNSSLSMTQHLALYREARAAISKAERTTP